MNSQKASGITHKSKLTVVSPGFEEDFAAEIHSHKCILLSCSTWIYHICYILILGIFHRLIWYALIFQWVKLLVLNLILMKKIKPWWKSLGQMKTILHLMTLSLFSYIFRVSPVSAACLHSFLCLCKSCKCSGKKE